MEFEVLKSNKSTTSLKYENQEKWNDNVIGSKFVQKQSNIMVCGKEKHSQNTLIEF